MQFADLQSLFHSAVTELICSNVKLFQIGDQVTIRKQNDSTSAYISGAGVVNDVGKFATPSYAERWVAVQDQPYLAVITHIVGNRLTVETATGFFLRYRDQALELAITDEAVLPKRTGFRSFAEVRSHIETDYVLSLAGKRYIVVAKHMRGSGKTLTIVSGSRAYSVEEMARRDCGVTDEAIASETIFAISKGEAPFRREAYALELWRCELRVCDATAAGRADVAVKAFLDKKLEKYLSLWKMYTDIEYDFVCKTKEKAGTLDYALKAVTDREVTLSIKNPEYINAFWSNLGDLGTDRAVTVTREMTTEKKRFPITGILSRLDAPKKQVHVQFKSSELAYAVASKGVLEPSIYAAEVQHERRESAFYRIFQRQSAKPQLAMLISGQDISHKQEKRKLTPLNEHVITSCFDGRTPTNAQKKAISLALNTPDFAIIQGPPGTGKTTVINAIMTALSDKEKDPELFFGKNLLTAYQKDATAHLAEKLRIYGLPVITYKGKNAATLKDGDIYGNEDEDQAVSEWIREKGLALALSDKRAKMFADIDALVDKLTLLHVSFDPDTASRERCRGLLYAYRDELEPFCRVNGLWSGDSYLDRVNQLIKEVELELSGDERVAEAPSLERQIANNLPTSQASMEDEGNVLVKQAIRHFSAECQPERLRKISAALDRTYSAEEISFQKVKLLKSRLLAELRVRSGLLSNNKLNSRAAELLHNTIRSIESAERSDEERIMANYLNAFADEDGMKESITEFMTVISATHQKAVSNDVKKRKDAQVIVYENVLIDEAARSCPPDLLIPLSCARDRMILVGDHKQLPQFVSDRVYDAIDGVAVEEKQSIIKDKPMFLHLIEQVRKLEQLDGIERFIQLDAQYRMPQTLGDLVSEQFYDGRLKSPQGNDEVQFGTELKYIQGKHLVWLDVPGKAGRRETKSKNGSYYRTAEAQRVVLMLTRLIEDSGDKGKDYTYGIMTFYNGQKDLINELIAKNDVLQGCGAKIDVGSVDAFQGMEYDVVFLSLVRSNTDYTNQKKRYGFTTDEHRLCVALSRAKRCMIIAGDSRMMRGKFASKSIPALVKFYEMCSSGEVQDARVFQDKNFSYPKGE